MVNSYEVYNRQVISYLSSLFNVSRAKQYYGSDIVLSSAHTCCMSLIKRDDRMMDVFHTLNCVHNS